MDTKNQIRKYKIQLNELRQVHAAAFQREKNIHTAETERIAIKKQEFREECHAKSESIKKDQIKLLEDLAQQQSELLRVDQELGELQGNKFKLREEVLRRIHAENRAKKDVRRNRQVFDKQLADVKSQIAEHQSVITGYDTSRRHINEDYYNWRAERDETAQRISGLTDGDKKRVILEEYLKELENDSRSNPEQRYIDLDTQKQQAAHEIEHLEYQYNKLHTYMNKYNLTHGHQELVISSYLRDTNARLPVLKGRRRELIDLITISQSKVREYDDLIQAQLVMNFPDELQVQEDRAHQRLTISAQRTESEYNPLIDRLVQQITDLELQLLLSIEQTSPPHSSNPATGIQSYSEQQPVASEQVTSISHDMNSNGNPVPVDYAGKSRKEIERLKKQQALLVQ
jgi:hypothetical protein